MLALAVVTNNERPDICGPCGGECCRRAPGAYHPSQFGPKLGGVRELLASGVAAIDWYENFSPQHAAGYYLRPARIDGRSVFDPSWGGTCVNLTPAGCRLPFERRPYICRNLKPRRNRHCRVEKGVFGESLSYREVATVWEPYFGLLAKIGREVVEQQRRKR